MAKANRAFALLILLTAWLVPSQVAMAAGLDSVAHSRVPTTLHQDDESDQEDESDSEDDNQSDDGDDGGKQFVPPPLVVKHKGVSDSSGKQSGKTSISKSGKSANAIAGIVPSTDSILLKAASLGIVTLEQAFATNDYVTSPVTPEGSSKDSGKAPAGRDPKPMPSSVAVDPSLNEPVVNALSTVSYEDPGREFIHKAYFGLAVLGAGAIGMAAHTISKTRRAAKADAQDYDYEVKTDA